MSVSDALLAIDPQAHIQPEPQRGTGGVSSALLGAGRAGSDGSSSPPSSISANDGASATGEGASPSPGSPSFLDHLMSTIGQFGAGFNHSFLSEGLGALPDFVGRRLSDVGVPGIQPHYYRDTIQGGLNKLLGTPPAPQGMAETLAHGAGSGLGDAASIMMPARALSGMAQLGPMVQGVAKGLASAPALQAASGMTGGAVGEETGSPLAGMAASMLPVIPSGLAAAARTGAQAMTGPVTPELQRLAQVAQQEGIPLTLGQLTNSRPLQAFESQLRMWPGSAPAAAAEQQAQQQGLNSAVLRRAGQNAQFATPEVLQAAKEDIGGRLQDLASRNTLQVTPELKQKVQALADQAAQFLTRDQAGPVLNRIKDFTDKITMAQKSAQTAQINSGRMTAEQYRAMVSGQPTGAATVPGEAYAALDSAISKQMRGTMDGNARDTLAHLRDILRSGMDASISGQDAEAWQQARREYANLMTIKSAMNRPSAATAAGNIPPAGLASAANNRAIGSNAFGYGDMRDLGAIGQAFLKDQVPNSGTPERQLLNKMMTGATAGFAGGGLHGALGGAAMLAGPLMMQRAAQAAYTSGLTRSVFTQPGALNRGAVGALGLARLKAAGRDTPAIPGAVLDPTAQLILQLSR